MSADLIGSLLTDEHLAYRRRCADFAAAEIAPNAEGWERAGSFDRALWSRAGSAGLLGPGYPVELGGAGGDVMHSVVATEAFVASGTSPGVVVGLGTLELALPAIMALGDEAQRRRFVSPVLSGERVAALALTEPGGGSDLQSCTTRAVRDGAGYRLTGQKRFISSGVQADQLTVLAQTEGGLTFFIVDKAMTGVRVEAALETSGWRASDTAALSFEDVSLPESHRLGREGSGLLCLMKTIHTERILLAAQGVAIASLALDLATARARQREAFGQPIGAFQVIRHKLAEMATQVQSARALTYQVARRLADGAWVSGEVAMAKNHAGAVAQSVCWEAVQIFGGSGCLDDSVVARLYRDARILPIAGGTHEIMNEAIASDLGL